jgi:hypothetical protein
MTDETEDTLLSGGGRSAIAKRGSTVIRATGA